MVNIPENQVTQQDMERWYTVQEQLSKLKNEEQLLRKKIFAGMFHDPVEGTNSVDLADGFVLKGKRVINRAVDDAAFKASIEELAKSGIPTDQIVKYKPELVTSAYRKLTAEQMHLMDTVLIIKDGMPGLEIVKPKRVKG